jgi:hypothetical protein
VRYDKPKARKPERDLVNNNAAKRRRKMRDER